MDKCRNTIQFGDDYGDNETTFHCELEKGHKGKCKESGQTNDKFYYLEWENK